MINNTLLEVKDLRKYFPVTRGFLKKTTGYVKAVDGISFSIQEGEIMALVGESGCGKTTTAKAVLRAVEPTGGSVLLNIDGRVVNVPELNAGELRQVRKYMQTVFQNPYTSLNPRMKVRDIIGEPLLVNEMAQGKKLEDRVAELMKAVGLRPEYMIRYPHAFSGGQRQRIGIARALALHPKLVICDEPVAALDVSIRAQITNLFLDLREEFHLTYLFITHDLSLVEHLCDRVAVMYLGKLVELTGTEELFGNPKHPYTEALLSAIPKPDPKCREEGKLLEGEVADPANPPVGCYFHPRCFMARDICQEKAPALVDLGDGTKEHLVACHFAGGSP